MLVRVTMLVEETRELDLDLPEDGFTSGDVRDAVQQAEPFLAVEDVLDYEVIGG